MKLTIIRIGNRIVNCQLDNGNIIHIACRWFTEDMQEGSVHKSGLSFSRAMSQAAAKQTFGECPEGINAARGTVGRHTIKMLY